MSFKQIKENIILGIKITAVVVVILGLGTGIQYVLAQQQEGWAPPGSDPPTDNIAPPINTDRFGQTKKGGVTIGSDNPPGQSALLVPSGRTGLGLGAGLPEATLHVKTPAGYEGNVLRLEIPVQGGGDIQPNMVLTALDDSGTAGWGLGGGGGGGGGGLTTYETHCSWIVAQIGGYGIGSDDYPEESELEPGGSLFWRDTCQNPDGSGSFDPPACTPPSIQVGPVTCNPTGISLDTAINERPDPSGSLPSTWNFMSRNASVGLCSRPCKFP